MGVCQYNVKFHKREIHKSKRLLNNISDIRSVHLKPVNFFFYLIFPYPESSQTTYYNSIIKLFPSNNYETKNIVRAFYISVWPLFCGIIFQRKTDHN